MAHEFESGCFFGEGAWHGLGTTLEASDDRRFSVDGTMAAAGMDWTVTKYPIQLANSPEVPEAYRGAGILGTYAVVRSSDGSILGTVGERYEELQNSQMFSWFQPFLDSQECCFETAGSLMNGKIVWVLAKLQREDIVLGQNEQIRKYLLLSSSHDGSIATRVGFSPIRVVCWNTLCMAHSDKAAKLLRVKHTTGQTDSLAAVRDCINLANEAFEASAAEYRRLMSCGLNSGDLRRYVKLVLEMPEDDAAMSTRGGNIVDRIVSLAVSGRGQDGSLTAWSAYQGVTEWLSHERQKDASKRLSSLWYGDSAVINQRAMDLALQLAS